MDEISLLASTSDMQVDRILRGIVDPESKTEFIESAIRATTNGDTRDNY